MHVSIYVSRKRITWYLYYVCFDHTAHVYAWYTYTVHTLHTNLYHTCHRSTRTHISSTMLETQRGTSTYTIHTTHRVHTVDTNTHPSTWAMAHSLSQLPIVCLPGSHTTGSSMSLTIHLVSHHPQSYFLKGEASSRVSLP